MSIVKNVRIAVAVGGRDTRVEVDGHDIASSFTAFSLHADATEPIPELRLDLVAQRADVTAGECRISLSEDTHAALVALGWTPPTPEEAP